MRRLPKLLPGTLTGEQRRLYDAITGGPRGQARPGQARPGQGRPGQGRPGQSSLTDHDGGLEGPFNAMLTQPAIGMALQSVGAAVRYQGTLPARARELAILVVAAHWDSEFEWHAHAAAGRAAGLSEQELAPVRDGREPELADPVERAAVRACRALVRRGDLDDAEYAAAVAALGESGVFELTTLAGYYATLALQLRVFRVGLPADSGDIGSTD
jgi:4-carboxymuconolactone decarboxylase